MSPDRPDSDAAEIDSWLSGVEVRLQLAGRYLDGGLHGEGAAAAVEDPGVRELIAELAAIRRQRRPRRRWPVRLAAGAVATGLVAGAGLALHRGPSGEQVVSTATSVASSGATEASARASAPAAQTSIGVATAAAPASGAGASAMATAASMPAETTSSPVPVTDLSAAPGTAAPVSATAQTRTTATPRSVPTTSVSSPRTTTTTAPATTSTTGPVPSPVRIVITKVAPTAGEPGEPGCSGNACGHLDVSIVGAPLDDSLYVRCLADTADGLVVFGTNLVRVRTSEPITLHGACTYGRRGTTVFVEAASKTYRSQIRSNRITW